MVDNGDKKYENWTNNSPRGKAIRTFGMAQSLWRRHLNKVEPLISDEEFMELVLLMNKHSAIAQCIL